MTNTTTIPAFLECKDGAFVSYKDALQSSDTESKLTPVAKRQLAGIRKKLGKQQPGQ